MLLVAVLATSPSPEPQATGIKPAHPAKSHASRELAKLAPADEYFGPLRMSGLAIRMRIDVLGRRYHARSESDDDLLHDAGDVETALHVWSGRYPLDTWLAPTAFHLAQLYAVIQTPVARARANATFRYVDASFGATHDGHLARLRIAQGFPALHVESPLASPTPGTSPLPDTPTPAVIASPATSGAPVTGSPAPAPSTTASAPGTPSPSPPTRRLNFTSGATTNCGGIGNRANLPQSAGL